ncbi:MAG: ThuA domain-containing protein [Defluviitaleaceae bacterium]|nr:ThuA domain-containing protein [Defluviitaleaceae bacterium]
MINVLIWNEYRHERLSEEVKAIYPDGIHGVLRDFLSAEDGLEVTCATLDEPECGLTQERVDAADVIVWWGHMAHREVPDEIAERVTEAVLNGCGLIALHSAHESKPFRKLMGTACSLRWRPDDRERVFTIAQHHQICRGIPEYFEVPREEMYGEKFDVPNPTEVIFISWFAGGEVFRSGLTFERGYGKVFYFQPGHEEYPTYRIPVIQDVIKNAVRWAARTGRRQGMASEESAPLEGAKSVKQNDAVNAL